MPSRGATSSIRADASRASASSTRDLRQLVEQGLTVREVPVDRGAGDPGCSRDVIHVRLLPLDREHPRRSVEDRRGDALLERLSGGRIGHRRLATQSKESLDEMLLSQYDTLLS